MTFKIAAFGALNADSYDEFARQLQAFRVHIGNHHVTRSDMACNRRAHDPDGTGPGDAVRPGATPRLGEPAGSAGGVHRDTGREAIGRPPI